MMNSTFPIKNTVNIVLMLLDFAVPSGMENQVTSIGTTRTLFPDHSHRPMIHPVMTFLRKSGTLVVV